MFYYVYVLESETNKRLYVGCTSDLVKRFKRHNNGLVPSTKPYIPHKLIYYEALLSKTDALIQERYLKSGSGREMLRKKLKKYFEN